MKPSKCGYNGLVSCRYCANYLRKGFCNCPSTHEPYPKDTELFCSAFKRSEEFYKLLEEEKRLEKINDCKQGELF